MQRIARQGWRQIALLALLLIGSGYLAQNLVAMQVLGRDSTRLSNHYSSEVAEPQTQPALRGMIVDDKGTPLVGTVTVFKLAAWPPCVTDPVAAAGKLRKILYPLRLPTGKQAHNKKAIAKARDDNNNKYLALVRSLT